MYTFTTSSGLQANAYIEEKSVKTDTSLSPLSFYQEETFATMPDYFKTNSRSVADDVYMEMIFQKSPVSVSYTRSFNKVDNYFSYVGGLIGTILGFMVVLSAYS